MYKSRLNRPFKSLPAIQGYKDRSTGETHVPLNHIASRTGTKYPRRKCHCKEHCGGHKRNTIAEKENWKLKIQQGHIED